MNFKTFICYALSYEACTICNNRILVRDENDHAHYNDIFAILE
jgi:hypothetical protein